MRHFGTTRREKSPILEEVATPGHANDFRFQPTSMANPIPSPHICDILNTQATVQRLPIMLEHHGRDLWLSWMSPNRAEIQDGNQSTDRAHSSNLLNYLRHIVLSPHIPPPQGAVTRDSDSLFCFYDPPLFSQ